MAKLIALKGKTLVTNLIYKDSSISILKSSRRLFPCLLVAYFCSVLVGGGLSYAKFRLQHALGLILLPSLIKLILKKKNEILRNYSLLFFALFFIWYSVSLLWVEDYAFALKYLFYILNGGFVIACIFCFFSKKQDLIKVLKAAKYVLLVEVLLAFFEIFTDFRWFISRHSEYLDFFGIDSQYKLYISLLNKLKAINFVEYEFINSQPFGFQWGPNRFSFMILLTWPFFFNLIKKSWLKVLVMALTVWLIYMGASRSIFLGLIISLLFSITFFFKRFSRSENLILTGFLILVLAIPVCLPDDKFGRNPKVKSVITAVLSYLSFDGEIDSNIKRSGQLNQRIYDLVRMGVTVDGSVGKRSVMRYKALKKFQGNEMLGVGAGNSAVESGMLFGKSQIHNFWLELLVEGGIIFFIFFLLWGAKVYLRVLFYSISKQSEEDPDLAILSKAVMMSVFGMSTGILALGTPIYFQYLWVLIGISLVVENLIVRKKAECS